jgi:hypothetical protein
MLLLLLVSKAFGQDSVTTYYSLEEGKLEPFRIQVTYNKTSHLIFPTSIRYVDLGSDLLVANKAEPIGNVLRIKSAVRDFEEETNFSVITEDGKFYSFDASYSSYPDILSYDLIKLQRGIESSMLMYYLKILKEVQLLSPGSLWKIFTGKATGLLNILFRKAMELSFQSGHCTLMTANFISHCRLRIKVMWVMLLSWSILKSSIKST